MPRFSVLHFKIFSIRKCWHFVIKKQPNTLFSQNDFIKMINAFIINISNIRFFMAYWVEKKFPAFREQFSSPLIFKPRFRASETCKTNTTETMYRSSSRKKAHCWMNTFVSNDLTTEIWVVEFWIFRTLDLKNLWSKCHKISITSS